MKNLRITVLAASTVLFAAIAHGADTKAASVEKWQASWEAFATKLQEVLSSKNAVTVEDMKPLFENKDVTWTGRVEVVDVDSADKCIEVLMTPNEFSLSGGKAKVPRLFLRPKGDNIAKWKTIRVADVVKFKTTLRSEANAPVVSLVHLLVGPYKGPNILIHTDDAQLVEVVAPIRPKAESGPRD